MKTTTMRSPMPVSEAKAYGKKFAAFGWSEAAIGEWLAEQGYPSAGMTADRIRLGYDEQKARG